MVVLVVTGWASLLVVLVGWRLPIGTRGLRWVSRRSLLLLLALLLVALLLAIVTLLGLVSRLLLAIPCRLGIAILVVTGWLAVSIVTDRGRKKEQCIKISGPKYVVYFIRPL